MWRRCTAAREVLADLTDLADLADAMLFETTPALLQQAVQALETSPLRGMDAIHIGAAMVAHAEVFVSADTRQRSAARSAGLKVVAV